MTKAVILLSGGIDSTVILANALANHRQCYALCFDYGQKHKVEIEHAKKIAEYYKVPLKVLKLPHWGADSQSALTSDNKAPKNRTSDQINSGVAPTYVPARNTIFIAFALAEAEIIGAQEIYLGPNASDRIPYPDCRPEYYEAYQKTISYTGVRLVTPLIELTKQGVVSLGRQLNIPFELTFTCYDPSPNGLPCQECDSCLLRKAALAR